VVLLRTNIYTEWRGSKQTNKPAERERGQENGGKENDWRFILALYNTNNILRKALFMLINANSNKLLLLKRSHLLFSSSESLSSPGGSDFHALSLSFLLGIEE
jgi:hypothetical protein